MDTITLCLTCILICIPTFLCCNINNCQTTPTLFSPTACSEVVKHLDCLKAEFRKCNDDMTRNSFTMMLPYSMRMHPPSLCGYDMDQVQRMFTARAGLMNSIMNQTNGMPPIAFGDDGPFDDSDSFDDDGPFDDGPFDDGPFDDGPFDDGPFDDDGVHPAVIAAVANSGKTNTPKPPPAPGLLPRFRGGAAMQTDDQNDDKSGVATWRPTALLLLISFCMSILVTF